MINKPTTVILIASYPTYLQQPGPMDWVDIPSLRLAVDTSGNIDTDYPTIVDQLRKLLAS
jgi:hypothetical protein